MILEILDHLVFPVNQVPKVMQVNLVLMEFVVFQVQLVNLVFLDPLVLWVNLDQSDLLV